MATDRALPGSGGGERPSAPLGAGGHSSGGGQAPVRGTQSGSCCQPAVPPGAGPPGQASFPTGQAGTRTLQGPLREGSVHLPVPSCPVRALGENHVPVRKPRCSQALTLPHPRKARRAPACVASPETALRQPLWSGPAPPAGPSPLSAPPAGHASPAQGGVCRPHADWVEVQGGAGGGAGDTLPVALRDAA